MASAVVSDNFKTSTGGVPQLGGTGATTCKAWVNFNGTGTVAIRDSYNVSSITDIGTGNTTVNFTNNLGSLHYSAVGTSAFNAWASFVTYTLSSVAMKSQSGTHTLIDRDINNVVIFSN